MRRAFRTTVVILLLLTEAVWTRGAVSAQPALDFPLPNGRFYSEANGRSGSGGTGYALVDGTEAFPSVPPTLMAFFTAFNGYGGVSRLGYPASRLFVFPDFPIQVCQKEVIQFQPGRGFFFLNIFDILHDRGFDAFLDSARSIPPQFDNGPDAALPDFAAVVARHQTLLNSDPAIRALYFSVPDPMLQFGLPTSYKDYGNVVVVRSQRAAFQHWRADVGPNKANSVTIVNGGDIGKEVGLFPAFAVTPVGPPAFNDNVVSLLPGSGQRVHSPIQASGYARFFEAAGNWEIRDAANQVIASGQITASAGTSSSFASYTFAALFTIATTQSGSLTIFSLSPRDGSRINVLTIPLILST